MNTAANKDAKRKIARRALLIVDDEQNVTMTLKMIFERRGYKVRTAYSCSEALAHFASGYRPDAVITDLNMERADIGLDVAKAAKQLQPPPVVVICTGYAGVENTQAALDMKVDYLATKPTDLEALVQAIDFMLLRTHAAVAAGEQAEAGGQRRA